MKKERDANVMLKTILNKMLEKYNIDVDHVKKYPEIAGVPWYQYYTLTTKEAEEWKRWSLEYLKTTRIPKRMHEIEFAWLNLMWGLKTQDDDNKTTE